MTFHEIFIKACQKGLGGGISGAIAGIIQVITLMWIRTIINYQCRYGTSYNYLSSTIWLQHIITSLLLRNAMIGIISSIVSDTIVNFIRVIKTTKQSLGSKHHDITYYDTIHIIVAADGIKGLFGRGLYTRMIGNALQSLYGEVYQIVIIITLILTITTIAITKKNKSRN